MSTVLELQSISKRFGRLAVLRRVDLVIRSGEIVGLIGANGAGKTTLMSIIAGLLHPSEGRRRYWGESVSELSMAGRARLAMVTHTAQVYSRLSARENLELFVQLRGDTGASASVQPYLERLGLGHAIDRLAGTFSRGMLQRLALARALLGRPDLLLLDEPFTALDAPGRALLTSVLGDERQRGAAVFLISHDFDALAEVADRVVLLEGGRIAGEVLRSSDGAQFRTALQDLAGRVSDHRGAVREVERVG